MYCMSLCICVIILFKIVLLLLNSQVTFKALRFDFWCFNATFNNISAISWRPVLVVEEAGVPRENHQPWTSNW